MEMQKNNVLVADCTQNIRQLSAAIFKNENFNITYSNSGVETISMLQEGEFDIVLLDTNIPDMDGFQVCRIIRSTENTKEIPIIFLTALDKAEIDKCYECGGDDYILKPFNPKEIVDKIKVRVALKRTRDELFEKYEGDRKALTKLTAGVVRMKHEINMLKAKNKLLVKTSTDYFELEKLKNNFLKIICHELRTPVSGILGFVEILSENPNSNENIDILKTIIFASKKLQDYTDTALMITHIEPEQINKHLRPTKLSSLVEYALMDVMRNFEKHELAINTSINDKLTEINIEPELIKDVIRIIITNAATYCPAKGLINIKQTEFANRMELEISNQGKGFEPDKLKNISSFLMKDGVNLRSEWPGMHFAVIKFIMDLHDASVQIGNIEEGGAVVKLIFPINPTKENKLKQHISQLN